MNLSALFLSPKRLLEIVNQSGLQRALGVSTITQVSTDGLQRVAVVAAFEEALLAWLVREAPPTIGESLLRGFITEGQMFTHLGSFYCRGVGQAAARLDQGKPVASLPIIRARLEAFEGAPTLAVPVNPENLTSTSARVELSGKRRLFLVGRVTTVTPSVIEAQAYAIGYLHATARQAQSLDRFGLLDSQMELFVDQIDSFADVRTEPSPQASELEAMRLIPEARIKAAFAEILGEPYVPRDWGGEQSDLVTSSLQVRGERVVGAFLFKGPSRYRPMTVADLGKNGDQISRLFSEAADLVVVQHCHQITGAVREHMRAFATRMGRLRPFCLINGSDTMRVLRAYSKLN